FWVRQTPPPGYGVLNVPDSLSVTSPPSTTRNFADSLRAGGWVKAHVYNDLNANGTQDAGEPPLENVKATMSTGEYGYTSSLGDTTLFAPVGSYSVSVTLPDSFAASTPNPASGTMTNGGTAQKNFG